MIFIYFNCDATNFCDIHSFSKTFLVIYYILTVKMKRKDTKIENTSTLENLPPRLASARIMRIPSKFMPRSRISPRARIVFPKEFFNWKFLWKFTCWVFDKIHEWMKVNECRKEGRKEWIDGWMNEWIEWMDYCFCSCMECSPWKVNGLCYLPHTQYLCNRFWFCCWFFACCCCFFSICFNIHIYLYF